MAADIEMHDDRVEVTGGPLSVEGRVDAVGGFGVRTTDGAVMVRLVDQSMHDRIELHLGNHLHEAKPARAELTIHSEEGTSHINGRRAYGFDSVSARALSGREGRLQTLELGAGEPGEGGGHDGLIVLRNDIGEETVRIDGATGDVVLAAIGSLVDKIAELQAQIDELSGHPGGGGGGGNAGGGGGDEDGPGGGQGGGQGGGNGGGPPGGGPGRGRGRGRGGN